MRSVNEVGSGEIAQRTLSSDRRLREREHSPKGEDFKAPTLKPPEDAKAGGYWPRDKGGEAKAYLYVQRPRSNRGFALAAFLVLLAAAAGTGVVAADFGRVAANWGDRLGR